MASLGEQMATEKGTHATAQATEKLRLVVQDKEMAAAQLQNELAEARQAALEGRGLEAEMQRQLQEQLAAEKQKRIEHAKEVAIRRIGKRDLSRGWQAWHDLYLPTLDRSRVHSCCSLRDALPLTSSL